MSGIVLQYPPTPTTIAVNNFPAVQPVSQSGTWTVNTVVTDSLVATYSACAANASLATLATDIFTIQGSATKIVRINYIEITMTTSGGGVVIPVTLIKRSSADTGGTSSSVTLVPYDSINAASTAVATSYTANPTALGTSVGILGGVRSVALNNNSVPVFINWKFGSDTSQPLTLRGTNQFLAINLGGTTVSGGLATVSVEWTEE